jgi:predicted O-methyltransferase YrrM
MMTRRAPTSPPVRSWDGPIEEHPICRGVFAALVFSGSREALGELPGEMTADTPFKFALIDPRLPEEIDFARSPGMPLPMWDVSRLAPTDGVCFVFSDRAHPAAAALVGRGAEEGRHFVVVEGLLRTTRDDLLDRRLAELLQRIGPDGRILILGYGDQGARIARRLRSALDLNAGRLVIADHGRDSAERAERDGLTVIPPGQIPADVEAVIYSPLVRYNRLHRLFEQARSAGRPCLDNRAAASGDRRTHFTAVGAVFLDEAAFSAISVDDRTLRACAHGLQIEAFIVREDLRRMRNREVRHLHTGQRAPLPTPDTCVDLSQRRPDDDLDPSTFIEPRRAWVSLRDTSSSSVFAAREFCRSIWPEATERAFPALNVACLGDTALERLLARHVHRAEIAQASQTSIQQVVLGIAAAHYATGHPIIELGSALGGSALLMAAATEAEGTAVCSIDPATADRDVMRFAFQREGFADRLHQHVMTSDEAIAHLQDLAGRAGLVFIDALHDEAAARADFRNYAPLVRTGGALLMHDVTPARFSVFRVVLEHILPDERFDIRCLVDGLAVFERRA